MLRHQEQLDNLTAETLRLRRDFAESERKHEEQLLALRRQVCASRSTVVCRTGRSDFVRRTKRKCCKRRSRLCVSKAAPPSICTAADWPSSRSSFFFSLCDEIDNDGVSVLFSVLQQEAEARESALRRRIAELGCGSQAQDTVQCL